MNTLIKTIEDLSLNAWPSHQIELYDGWILRFSYFYTHRTNSVEQIGPSTIPVEEKCSTVRRSTVAGVHRQFSRSVRLSIPALMQCSPTAAM